MNDEITILIHGFGKNKNDMSYLEKGLSQFGFNVISVNLPTTFGSLNDCIKSLHFQVNDIIMNHKKVHYVAHSMGGLIARYYIKSYKQDNVDKCVFIATPHKGSKLADIADKIPLYSKIFRPIKHLRTTNDISSVILQKSSFGNLGLIAGTKNKNTLGKLFLSNKSDGRVEVSSVEIDDADEFITFPFGHQKIHHQYETLNAVKFFLRKGSFNSSRQMFGKWK